MNPHYFRIFLSSPGDVPEERAIVHEVADHIQKSAGLRGRVMLEVVAWDRRGAPPMEANLTPQEAIRRGLPRPAECDIVVVIFWSRLGTPLELDGQPYHSGTHYEYLDAFNAAQGEGSPRILVYRRTQEPLISLSDPERDEKIKQWDKVNTFFKSFEDEKTGALLGFYNRYQTPDEFRQQFEDHLPFLLYELLPDADRRKHIPSIAREVSAEEPFDGIPFPGLHAFTPQDAPIFFGRGRETDMLTARLLQSKTRFLAVVGASGSGKSSLVGAGLIPRLAHISGENRWVVVRFTPDEVGAKDPFASLTAAVLRELPKLDGRRWGRKLHDDPSSISGLIDDALQDAPDDAQFLLFIDQFEELFTTVRAEYINPLLTLIQATQQHGRSRVVITMRGDFYGIAIENLRMAELLKESTFPLAAPGSGALHEMITRPAERAGVTFEPNLVERILSDSGTEPGALALTAFALHELYTLCKETRIITHAAYESLGEVKGAIGQRSEAVFKALSIPAQKALPAVFRELISVNDDGTATRQRAPLYKFANLSGADELIRELVDARLLTSSGSIHESPHVEVAHEALLRSWDRLVDWVESTRDDLRLLRQVRLAADEWERNQRSEPYRWAHERLEPVYRMIENLGIDLSYEPRLQAFVRPETEYLVEKFRNSKTRRGQRFNIIERLGEIGEAAVPALVDLLTKFNVGLDTIPMVVSKRDNNELEEIYATMVRFPQASVDALLRMLNYRPAAADAKVTPRRNLIALHTLATLCKRQPLKVPVFGGARPSRSLPSVFADDDDDEKPEGYLVVLEPRQKAQASAGVYQRLTRFTEAEYTLSRYRWWLASSPSPRPSADEHLTLDDERMIPAITACLTHELPEMRALAVYAIGELGLRTVNDALIACLHDRDETVQFAALRTIGRLEISDAHAAIGALMAERFALPYQSEIDALLLEVALDDSIEETIVPITALMQQPDDPRLPLALLALHNTIIDFAESKKRLKRPLDLQGISEGLAGVVRLASDANLRLQAANTLVEIGLASVAQPLALERLRIDDNSIVREYLAEALVRMNTADSGQLLVDAAIHGLIHDFVAARVLRYTPDVQTAAVREYLHAKLNDSQTEVRTAVCEALPYAHPQGDGLDESISEQLIALLDDSAHQVRAAAADALGEMQVHQASVKLVNLLRDTRVSKLAERALTMIEAPDILAVMDSALESTDMLLVDAVRDFWANLRPDAESRLMGAVLRGASDPEHRERALTQLTVRPMSLDAVTAVIQALPHLPDDSQLLALEKLKAALTPSEADIVPQKSTGLRASSRASITQPSALKFSAVFKAVFQHTPQPELRRLLADVVALTHNLLKGQRVNQYHRVPSALHDKPDRPHFALPNVNDYPFTPAPRLSTGSAFGSLPRPTFGSPTSGASGTRFGGFSSGTRSTSGALGSAPFRPSGSSSGSAFTSSRPGSSSSPYTPPSPRPSGGEGHQTSIFDYDEGDDE